MNKIHAIHPGTGTVDITDGLVVLLDAVRWSEDFPGDTPDEQDAVVHLARAAGYERAEHLAARVEQERREELERQRARDEWARTQAQRKADVSKAAAQLAAEMREREPGLVRAGWTDAQLVELHRMRNAGLA